MVQDSAFDNALSATNISRALYDKLFYRVSAMCRADGTTFGDTVWNVVHQSSVYAYAGQCGAGIVLQYTG